jgi:formylglycine-generating enzyme required for sulfatase activity
MTDHERSPVHLPRVTSWAHPLQGGRGPEWADASGVDGVGPWVEVGVDSELHGRRVVQRMRWIPPGEFMMGSPADEPGRMANERRVRASIPRGFWLGDTPVTQRLWVAVIGTNPSQSAAAHPKSKAWNRPVEQVSFDDAQAFLSALSERVVPRAVAPADGAGFRLPREHEWEWACRSSTTTAHYGQPTGVPLRKLALYCHHVTRPPGPVAQRLPNAWGCYDMLGNVNEWCDDLWKQRARPWVEAPDPTARGLRVTRGGSSCSVARHIRAAARDRERPDAGYHYLGFRLARSHEP